MTNRRERGGVPWAVVWEAAMLALITAAGFGFRWLYAHNVSFFVDEYLTARAAQRILSQGVPLLPSGNFYSHGLLLSYLEAAVLGLGGSEAWMLRLPVLALSAGAIVLAWWFGRRLFSPTAGLVAAALLAFAPEAILWGGRVRMYAPLQFFVLLATVIFYLWVVREQDRPAWRVLFVLAYWGALFNHAEAMLLLPIWGLWALVQRGWRWCLRPANLLTFALSGLAIVIEVLLRRLGPPVQARVTTGVLEPISRQYLGPALDWPGIRKVVEPLFLTPARLPLTLLILGGMCYLAWTWRHKGRPGADRERQAMLYLAALLLPTLAALLFVMSPEWKSPRYALMLLPHLFLIAGGLLAWLGRWLQSRLGHNWTWLGATAIVLLVAAGAWPSAWAATQESVPSYDRAFAYVEAHQQPGDLVVTFLCPAAFFHLGRCDGLAIPTDFSGFATQKDGRWVSGWDQVPLLDGVHDLQAVLADTARAWFVIDQGRFTSRYDADFQQAVLNNMDLVFAEREVLVFRSREQIPLEAVFGNNIRLLGYDLSPGEAISRPADDTLALTLFWQADRHVKHDFTVFVHLVDVQGKIRAQADGPPVEGNRPTSSWQPGEIVLDVHQLVLGPEVTAGEYWLWVGLYTLEDGLRLPLTSGPATGGDRLLIAEMAVR